MTTMTDHTNHEGRGDLAARRPSVPYIDFQRAAVAFDDFCRITHEFFREMKLVVEGDLTPDAELLEAMILNCAVPYIGPGWEGDVTAAVGNLVAAIARPANES